MIESLESRRLFAITFANGVLTVEGNKKDEILGVTTEPTSGLCVAQIQRNGELIGKKTFKTSKIDLVKIFGKKGNDIIQLGAQFNGTTPKGKLFGGPGIDSIGGGTKNDTIVGGPGDDNVDGNAGNDLVKGNGGLDVVRGRTGNDTLIGGAGQDTFHGDEGNDLLKAQDNGFDWMFDTSGTDTAFVDVEDNQTGGGDIETVNID